MFGLLVFSRPDEWITRYNANQYLAGNLKEFDTHVVSDMSEDAWAGLSFYDLNQFKGKTLNAELQKRTEKIQDDFYQTLNLSAWELMYNVK